ncbi:dihydroorotate dehydrogenase electron transfer subunit [Alkalithermobacter thermoalcaliphilus JW-YL-7 = DSM 7308]|uniref:Dihydroorotate dehydrogenase electron transfer subunit n=1 Tax=Alkalithermobacter thermoalcaliphilus JW-YL-7 = DSM 7308 TaxID=1121328 RepID=A0A150FN91_CLOPD|nr:Dihydroorotate dehydrogenase, electron transfer subunit [[Clostridium] paradoxum JW-YL-7 = DSM 7308]SHK89871.1 dihydroorotate dehydrogenase electron transfer subunit [[Clostridium] paradoxum JW-YL-7 = DSM 7308]
MAKVISNEYIGEGMYLLKVEGKFEGSMGQFYMLRAWDEYPLLSRPISIHDIGDDYISFLYKVVGKGTKILSKLKCNDTIKLEGPYGNTFPKVEGKIALVGGGMGVAPLYLAAKTLKNVDIYMGFSKETILLDEYRYLADTFYVTVGKNITDILDVSEYDYIMTCGPMPMMKKIVDMAKGKKTKVYVSIEKRMACGVGGCLVCTCKTKSGNKRTCLDGPVFLGDEVIFDD